MGDTILLAVALQRYTDITPRAIAIREVASDIAEFYNAPMVVLTSHVPLAVIPEGEDTEQKMTRFLEPLNDRGLRVKSIVRKGSPRDLIPEVAKELDARLIVVGTHSKRGILDTIVGGTAKAVIASAPCRVLLVAATTDEDQKTRELIAPEYPFIFPYG